MCEADDYGSVLLANEWRRARKEYGCYACRETIRVGDRYHLVAQKDDGEFGTFKHCARCWAMGKEILKAGAETWQYDLQCGVSWQEAFNENPPAEVAALAFLTPDEAQRKVPERPTGGGE